MPTVQRERAERTAVVYRLAKANGAEPLAALMDWWAVGRPRAAGLLWEARALRLLPTPPSQRRI